MITKTQVGSSPRIDGFTARRLKGEIFKLSSKKDRSIHLWLKIWHQAKNLPDNYEKELELMIVKSMKPLKFSFRTGHRVYNEGVCRGLGRTAMLLGAFLAERDLKKKKRDNVQYARILEKMRDGVSPNGDGDLNEKDREIMALLNT